jgi:uncharacterized repeat protein (TIGR01451 family)
MFRKLVSSLPFSPALVGQLAFYARRLSKEQATRRLGLIFTALALVVQGFAVLSPPEPTYATSPTNTCNYNNALTKTDSSCKPCPYNTILWIKDSGCKPNITRSVDATNLSLSGKNAASSVANPGDRIQFNLHTTNTGPSKINVVAQDNLADLLEYATVIDAGGGTFDQSAKIISWGTVALENKQVDVRSFVVQVNDSISATPRAADNPLSYDCMITSVYGNTLNVSLSCPLGKQLENTVRQLPGAGVGANIAFAASILLVVVYFYSRSRQLNRELKVIRRDFNVG